MPSYDQRSQNYQEHGAHNLRAREELARRGVPADQLPSWDTTNAGREAYMNAAAPRRDAPVNSLNSNAELDALAQSQGFPTYEAMIAWERNRQNVQSGSVGQGTPKPAPAAPAPAQPQAGGLGAIFNYISNAMGGG